MKKTILFLALCIGVVCSHAETVSQKQARDLAHIFFNEAAGRVTAPPKLVYNGRKLTTNRLFTPFYVYNTSLGGFVIISAENKAYPILGFSLKESFDPDRLGETELALLQSYAMEIEQIRYDSEPIENTVKAWQDYPGYVNGILKARYIATDPKFSTEDAEKMVKDAVEKDDAVYSDLYTPDQWREMIVDELAGKESAPLVIVGTRELLPAVVYGRQGDFFRIEMTTRNNWLMRLNATEIIPSNMVSAVVNPIFVPDDFEEELPFAEHDAFLDEVAEIEEMRTARSSIDLPQAMDDEPIVKSNGGGHFEVLLPENVSLARVYNLSGAMVRRFTFNDTYLANIDISAEPTGFYFVIINGESGKPYGLKIYK